MFSPANHIATATGAMIDSNTAFFTNSIHALFDAGMHAAEHHADTLRTFFASATVATRQLWSAGAFDWVHPVVQHPSQGDNTASAHPFGTALAYVSSPELAAGSGRTDR
jgi:hypothetical protein